MLTNAHLSPHYGHTDSISQISSELDGNHRLSSGQWNMGSYQNSLPGLAYRISYTQSCFSFLPLGHRCPMLDGRGTAHNECRSLSHGFEVRPPISYWTVTQMRSKLFIIRFWGYQRIYPVLTNVSTKIVFLILCVLSIWVADMMCMSHAANVVILICMKSMPIKKNPFHVSLT